MKLREHTDFPTDLHRRVFHVCPRKGIVIVDGFRDYSLKELKKIELNTRLSFPPELFKAINNAK